MSTTDFAPPDLPARDLYFPSLCVGYVYIEGTIGTEPAILEAVNVVHIPAGCHVKLEIYKERYPNFSFLERFKAADIQGLVITGNQVIGEELCSIGHLTGMETLGVFAEGLTAAGLQYLTGLTRLGSLNLAHTQLKHDAVREIRKLSSLRDLNLFNTGISDTDVCDITSLASLRVLSLRLNSVRDVGMRHVLMLKNLCKLDISHTNRSIQGLVKLRVLDKLKHLFIEGLSLGTEEINQLNRALPNCRLYVKQDPSSGQWRDATRN